jgi:predicted nuclease with TOPRIM domain
LIRGVRIHPLLGAQQCPHELHQLRSTNFGAPLNASFELNQLKKENELLKKENEQLEQQIEQFKESIKKPKDTIDALEEIIDERDDDIDTLKNEIDGAPNLAPHVVLTPVTLTQWAAA